MILETFYTPGLAIYSYLLGDAASRRAVVIDPTRNVEDYLAFARQQGLQITDIIETHVHADFASGAKELKHQLQGKPTIHCSAMGGKEWIPQYADHPIQNGDVLQLGGLHLQAVHTPGHTPEHVMWLCFDDARSRTSPCLAFTGDFLFVGGVGRPDLLGEDEVKKLASQLYHSLFTVLEALPDYLEIYPGHGAGSLCGKGLSARPTSTLGYERLFNPSLAKKPFEQWVGVLLQGIPAAPPNFQRLKQLNIQGSELLSEQSYHKGSAEMVIDLRHPEEYAKGHIKDSVNIPLGSAFSNWVGAVLTENVALGIVGNTADQIAEAERTLLLIGFDRIVQRVVWNDSIPSASLPLETVKRLADKLNATPERVYVLDVRTPAEWHSGHIKGAHHIELTNILKEMHRIPTSDDVNVICGSGYRASVVASLLKKQGYKTVANVQGGMSAWRSAGLPMSMDTLEQRK